MNEYPMHRHSLFKRVCSNTCTLRLTYSYTFLKYSGKFTKRKIRWQQVKRKYCILAISTSRLYSFVFETRSTHYKVPKLLRYTRKNWSGWCNVVRWTTPEQCYQDSTTLVELTVLMSSGRSIVVRCWQRTIVVTMLLEHELTIVDEKSLLIVVNNDWTMVVDNSCWQGAAQHCWTVCSTTCWTVCSTTLQQFVANIDQVHFCACSHAYFQLCNMWREYLLFFQANSFTFYENAILRRSYRYNLNDITKPWTNVAIVDSAFKGTQRVKEKDKGKRAKALLCRRMAFARNVNFSFIVSGSERTYTFRVPIFTSARCK